MICTVKPFVVGVGVPKVGVNAAPTTEVAVTGAVPLGYPVLVVVIIAVELVPAVTPVTVTKPVPLPVSVTTTVPDVAVPAHVYAAS